MKKTASGIMCILLIITSFLLPVSAAEYKDYRAYSQENKAEGFPESTVDVFTGERLCDANSEFSAEFRVEEAGFYNVSFDYCAETDNDGELRIGFGIDGEYPFETAKKLLLPRYYHNNGDIRRDGMGNEFSPEQTEIKSVHTYRLSDYESFDSKPCSFFFSKGSHRITIDSVKLPFRLYGIKLVAVEKTRSYEAVSSEYSAVQPYGGDEIITEGEAAFKKSDFDLSPKSDNTTPNVKPSNAYYQRINYIGGGNWSDIGDTLYWEIDVPEDSLYELSFYYRQSYVLNGNSYRTLRVDGKIPFAEAESLAFPYNTGWKAKTIGADDGEPYLLKLTKGKHVLSLCVTLGPLSDFCAELEQTVYDIGTLYRQIVMITGETPDNNRDYNLFGQIPDFEENLTEIKSTLESLAASYEKLSGKNGGSTVSTINSMANTVKSMLKYKYKAQQYKKIYYSNYSSLSAALYDMMSMPLDIDSLTLTAPKAEASRGSLNFFNKTAYSAGRFLASFVVDYNNISGEQDKENSLTLWVNWGRDQAQVLNFLIQSGFTEKTGITVDVKITNASLVQGILSGNIPDCVLQHSRTEPINLAMRGAAYDLTEFSDFNEVITRFSKNAAVPYEYKGGVYALPDTQSFPMMFIRTDVFDEMKLSVPKTWDEFISTAKILAGNNLETGIGNSLQSNTGAGTETGIGGIFKSLLFQFGGSLYNKELNATDLLSGASVKAFEMYTDFFNKYDCPVYFNFYNRFRTGLMPLGIQDYTMYSTLKATAPEINDKWHMYKLPGVAQSDGSINNTASGTGTACMILKDTGHESNAWELLKWWTSAETQSSYSRSLEGILGIAGRVAVANTEAAGKLSWDNDNFDNLLEQWLSVDEMNEVPGSYYISRVLDQAYWNVVVKDENPRDMLYKWGAVADKEIARKIAQYEKD